MDRKYRILKAIIESFIISAEPVGSQYLLEKYDFEVSPATVRNDMAALEKQGYIFQPYTSAGRVPTTLGFRTYVDDLMTLEDQFPQLMEQRMEGISEVRKAIAEEKIYRAVSLLARVTENVSFATIPSNRKTYFLGLSNILRSPEFQKPLEASTVVRVLEDADRFLELLEQLPLSSDMRVFIGEENAIKEIQSCSIIATEFHIEGVGTGVLGILGPVRMNYPYNMGALEEIKRELEG